MKCQRSWSVFLFAVGCVALAPAVVKAAAYRMTVKSPPELGGKCVSTTGEPFVQGMRVFIWDCTAGLAQMLDYDDQTRELKFGANCVEVLSRGDAQNAIAVGKCNGSAAQHWTMAASKDNYQIVSANGLCANIANGVIANGTPLDVTICAPDNLKQVWALFQASEASAGEAPAIQTSTPAQTPAALKAILERHDLMGTFAEDCGKDPSDTNQYIVHRVADAGRVERNQMKDRNARSYAALVENAEELSANDVAMNIVIMETVSAQMKGWKMHLITRVDDNRIRLMQSGPLTGPYAGRTTIFAGKAANGGGETHWLTKCK